ncbi:MAG: DDE-type integrase/transposase/recombinase [Rhizomicrobium sp.]
MTLPALPPNKEWLTAAEAAAEGLPGLPSTKRSVNRLITDAGVKTRKRDGRGGGREFHWSDLPREARDEYLKRHAAPAAGTALTLLAPKARESVKYTHADARLLIVKAAGDFIARYNHPKGEGLALFSGFYNGRQLPQLAEVLPEWVYRIAPGVAPHQLRAWESKIRHGGHGALVDRRGRPPGTTIFEKNPQLRAATLMIATAQTTWSAMQIQKALEDDWNYTVALRTLQLFLRNFRKDERAAYAVMNYPDQARSHFRPAFGRRDEDVTFINARWELDATVADAMCLVGNSLKRCSITGVIDVFTRRAVLLVSDKPRAAATQALFRKAILAWGLPAKIKTDNGKEFTARDVERLCADLGIEIEFSRPFHPDEKPFIERFFGTLNHGFFPLVPHYVGSNVAERKAIENRASFEHRFGDNARMVIETPYTPEQLQARLDAWLRDVYEQAPHEGLKNGTSPWQKADAFQDAVVRLQDERALDRLLFDAPGASGIRNVGKRGIRIDSRLYIAGALGEHMGRRVHVRLDPHDLGYISVYSADRSTFLCVAECVEITGGDRQRIAIAAVKSYDTRRRQIVADNQAVQKVHPLAGFLDRMLGEAANDGAPPLDALSDASREAMRVANPRRLIEAQRAADALDEFRGPAKPNAPTAAQSANADAIIAEIDARNAAPAPRMTQCDGYERPDFNTPMGFWRWAQEHLAAGNALDAQDADYFADLAKNRTFQLKLAAARSEPIAAEA